MPATIGVDALVPPTTIQPPEPALYTARPVEGSPTAATSEVARLVQPVFTPLCQLGLEMLFEHELPPELHAPSLQPRELVVDFTSFVPPTPTTYCEVLG